MIGLLVLDGGSVAHALELYVAPGGEDSNPGTISEPFATLERARDEIRVRKKATLNENVIVWLRGGTYVLSEPLVLGLEDSATQKHSITYAAYQDEHPVLTSTTNISGWKKLETLPAGLPRKAAGQVWVADVSTTEGPAWRFHTLWDGQRLLPRARCVGFILSSPSVSREQRWSDLTTLRFPKGAIKNWKNLEDVEVLVRPNHEWVINYLPLASVDESKSIAKTTLPATYNMTEILGSKGVVNCWVENVLEGLNRPGEWVLDTQAEKLYLWPASDIPSRMIVAPRLRTLIRIEGKNVEAAAGDIPVRGITFRGLTLTGAQRDLWAADDKGIQHDWEMWDKDNALVRFRGAANCALVDCRLVNSGGGGVRVDRYGQNIRIVGNHFRNLGGTAVLLCGYGPGMKDVNKSNLVANNNIQTCSQLYWHNPGIFIWQSGENRILNNRIHDLPYNGIVLSGVRPRFFNITDPVKWTQSDAIPKNLRENMQLIRWDEVGMPRTADVARRFAHARNNLVQDNEIHDCMQTLGDGNAIYLSCAAEGNLVKRNLVYNNPRTEEQIRFDDDQEEATVEQNIIIGPGIALKHNNYILNNVIIEGMISFETETEPGCRVERNILFHKNGDALFFSGSDRENRGLKKANADHDLFYCRDLKATRSFLQHLRDAYGLEIHGLAADPAWVDIDHWDLRLTPNSPARKLDIQSIDIHQIGLLGDPAFARLAKQGLQSTGTGNKVPL